MLLKRSERRAKITIVLVDHEIGRRVKAEDYLGMLANLENLATFFTFQTPWMPIHTQRLSSFSWKKETKPHISRLNNALRGWFCTKIHGFSTLVTGPHLEMCL